MFYATEMFSIPARHSPVVVNIPFLLLLPNDVDISKTAKQTASFKTIILTNSLFLFRKNYFGQIDYL